MRELPTRKNMRLQGYDYNKNGMYFITFCVKDRHELLGEVVGARIARPYENTVVLSDAGMVVNTAILNISKVYPAVFLDKYIIMPNHVHMILCIDDGGRAMRAPTISTVINQMKGYITKQLGYSIWQKLYHDHIIRNETEYQKIWQYIDTNSANWEEDCYYERYKGKQPCFYV